jgi:hypothetical protein
MLTPAMQGNRCSLHDKQRSETMLTPATQWNLCSLKQRSETMLTPATQGNLCSLSNAVKPMLTPATELAQATQGDRCSMFTPATHGNAVNPTRRDVHFGNALKSYVNFCIAVKPNVPSGNTETEAEKPDVPSGNTVKPISGNAAKPDVDSRNAVRTGCSGVRQSFVER